MKFRYFARPDAYGLFLEDIAECEMCNEDKKCFDAESFYGEDSMVAICVDCLAEGRLEETDLFTCEGDAAELERQIRNSNPTLSLQSVKELVDKKTDQLEKTTPRLVTWQDWAWPCADGDYCVFLGLGSKPLYNRLAKDGNGNLLFSNSIYYNQREESCTDDLWDMDMPDLEILRSEDAEEYGMLFYVFKSVHSDTIITIWDSE